jgi:hypothetical protein
MKTGKIMIFLLTIALIFCAVSLSAEQKKTVNQDSSVKNLPKPGPGVCSDPAATMQFTKALNAGMATITMKGTICNMGQADYNGKDPLDAHFMVYTWHPPKTPAQEHDLKTISHTKVSTKLKKGECKNFSQTYKIAGVTQWGHYVENQTERPASRQFVFRVEKKYPMFAGDTDFSKIEDCDISNNAAQQAIDYMEKE